MYYICLEYIEIPISILTLFIRRYMSRAFQNVPPVSKPSMLADQDAWPQVHWHRVQSNWAFMYLQVEPTIKLASNVTHVSMKFKTDISWLTITQFVAAVIRCPSGTLQKTTYVNDQSILDRKHLLRYLQLGCGRRVPCVWWKKLPLWLHEGKLLNSKAWANTHFVIICWQCSECGVTLKGRYYTVNGMFICEEDYKVKLALKLKHIG